MIPGATDIASGGVLLSSAMTSYPLLAVIIAFIVVLFFGVTFIRWMKKGIGR